MPESVILAAVSDFRPSQLEACASFDTAMILLNGGVNILAGTNGNRFGRLPEPALRITLQNSYSAGFASNNGNVHWPAVAGQFLAPKAFMSIGAEYSPPVLIQC